jgi:CelD/BcsL family acetyltransferase involved in cellulose biosynthesis
MQIVQVSDAGDLAGLADRWNSMSQDIPFRSWDWLECWWRKYGSIQAQAGDAELCVLSVEDGGEVIGIAPWFVHGSRWTGRTLRFLGTGDVCSEYLGLLSMPGKADAVAHAVAGWLSEDAEGEWDLIELTELEANDATVCAFADAMSSRGCTVDWRPGASCWRAQLPTSQDEYFRTLSKSHRKQVRRMERRVFETNRARLHTVVTEAELARALNLLVSLHQQRQRSLGRLGCFASAQFSNFHTEATRRLLRRGRLRLHWLELDGRPVAVDYHLAGDVGIFVYQGGMDPTALEESPGQLITLATLKLAIEQGFRFFDFLRGDEAYKAHWRAAPRPSQKLRIVPNRLGTLLRHNIWAAAKGFQSLVKSGPMLALPAAHQFETAVETLRY